MKNPSFRIVAVGLLLLAGVFGIVQLRHKERVPVDGSDQKISASVEKAVSNTVEKTAVSVKKPAPPAPVMKKEKQDVDGVQVVFSPSSRFQPIEESLIRTRRLTDLPDGRKKREMIIRSPGKYPFRRVEDILTENKEDNTWTVSSRTEMVADHVLVKLQEGQTEEELDAALRRHGNSILRKLTLPRHYIVGLSEPSLDAVPDALSSLGGESNIFCYVEPDYVSRIQKIPNDTEWGSLWGMSKIEAPAAWDVTTGSVHVTVAVIDTGIDLDHPDLVSNLWKNSAEVNGIAGVDDDGNGYVDDTNGWDFVNNDQDPNPVSEDDVHGTHCAGTIGAVGNNGQGVVGVCWTVRLMALRGGSEASGLLDSDIAEAVCYAADNGADIISASYGGSIPSDTERSAMEYADDRGVLFVAAAGNDGSDNDITPVYPACYNIPNIISVAAKIT